MTDKEYRLDVAAYSETPSCIAYADELNPEQCEAVFTLTGPVLCLAGAGSGKTRTLVYRTARILETGIDPESVLLLTFTRKAAKNMLDRVAELIGPRGRRVSGGTYHSFAHRVLRQYSEHLGLLRDFTIIDEGDSGDLLNLLRAEMGLTSKEIRFPQKKTLCTMVSRAVNRSCTPREVVERDFPQFREHIEELELLFQRFNSYKQEHGLLDYDDLLVYLERLLRENTDVCASVQKKYRFVMADEYQDTNEIQARITSLLAGERGNVMVVGDDAQSIYSFRGACFQNILRFAEIFPHCRVITLSQNYRSTKGILQATNSMMKNAASGFTKDLVSVRGEGNKPVLISCADEPEQSMFVAQRILELHAAGVPLRRIAVLFRSGFHAFQLELELKRRGIPYIKWGGYKFLDAAHIKDMLAYLRIIHNSRDTVAWQRVLLMFSGIGEKTVSKFLFWLQSAADPYDVIHAPLPARSGKQLEGLEQLIRQCLNSRNQSPRLLAELAGDFYLPLLKQRYDDYPKRIKEIDMFVQISDRFASLAEFLADIALEPPKNSVDGLLSVSDADDRLILSTVHSAKGLEWHSIFVIWALDGRFPSIMSIKDAAALDEERRLFYVAMTRAEDNLYLIHPAGTWDATANQYLQHPSRFIDEIGHDHLERWVLRR